jgi:hypothetical protein
MATGIGKSSFLFALALGVTSAAQAQQDRVEYVLPGDTVDMPFATLRGEFSQSARGRELLNFADVMGIGIAYDENLSARGRAPVTYDKKSQTVFLRPDMNPLEENLRLGEGLRRAWMETAHEFEDIRQRRFLDAEQSWALRQGITADAVAYGALIVAEQLEAKKAPALGKKAAQVLQIAEDLREKIKDGSLTRGEYRRTALLPAFRAIDDHARDNIEADMQQRLAACDSLDRRLNSARLEAEQVDTLKAFLKTEIADSKFNRTILRKLGGTGLDLSAKTAWKGSANKLLDRTPFRSLSDPRGMKIALREMSKGITWKYEIPLKKKLREEKRRNARAAKKTP